MQGVNKRDKLTQHEQTALTSTTFSILKRMIVTWMKIATTGDENSMAMANELLSNFHRWIKDESSLLYDPVIYDNLHNYMKRYFFHMISEFKRLGANIIHGSFNKIIIDTKKRTLHDAKNYINFILEKILKNVNFRALEFNTNKWWSYLIYLDLHNSVGMEIVDPEKDNDDLDVTPGGFINDSKFYKNLSVINYLSTIGNLRKNFVSIMENCVTNFHEKNVNNLLLNPPGETPIARRSHNESSILDQTANPSQNLENIDPKFGYLNLNNDEVKESQG